MNDNRAQHVHKMWTVTVSIDEHGAETRATARLHWRDQEVVGVGVAKLNPSDRYFAAIGDELAAARALFDAAQQVMAVTEDEIENVTDEPVTFRRWNGVGLSIGAEQ
jgi:hypothetical protein